MLARAGSSNYWNKIVAKPIQNQSKKTQSGFTLIEVIITMALIVATLVVYNVTSKMVLVNRSDRYKEIALRIADQKMQNLRTTAFSSLPSSGSFSDTLLSSLPGGSGNMTLTTLNAKTKDVVVTVTWNNPTGTGTQQVQLQTYITEGGIGQWSA